MKLSTKFFTILILIPVITMVSCGGDDKKEDEVTYTEFFKNTAENIIQPKYVEYKENSEILLESTTAFINSPTLTSLENLRTDFISNYRLWQHVSLYNFGPAADAEVLLNSSVNSFPTLENKIESNIQSGNYNLETADNIYARGLPAVDYLLNGINKTNSDILNDFSDINRQKYLKENIQLIVNKITLAINKWKNYESTYKKNIGTGKSSSLTLIFNAFLEDYEALKRNKFALPAGFATEFSVPIDANSNKVESRFNSDLSYLLMLENLKAHKDFYLGIGKDGVDGIGFYDKLIELKANSTIEEGNLYEIINDQFNYLIGELDNKKTTNFKQDIDNNSPLENLNKELQKMVPLLKGDLKSALTVPITGVDADGD